MRAALARHQPFYREVEDEVPAATGPEPKPETHARVFFLTDGRCASACLDFADRVKLLPDVTHVGRITSRVELPSGAASLMLPVKVYRNRPRGYNAPYVPQVRYDGDLSDTAALQRWIEGLAQQR